MRQGADVERPTRAASLIDAAEAIVRFDELRFVEVAPWRAMASGPDSTTGSIPGAIAASIAVDFSGEQTPTSGHLPLPPAEALHDLVRRWGADDGRQIVVYTRRIEEFSSATRAWFTLGWARAADALILDGGLPAWVRAAGPIEDTPAERADGPGGTPASGGVQRTGRPLAEPSAFVALSAAELLDRASWGTVLDARPADVHQGFVDEPRSGHVPHAVHAPTESLLTEDGLVRSDIELRKWFLARGALGAHDVGAYCGGGVASTTIVFAAALIDQPVGLYVDSWSAWQRDESLPVERGTRLTRSNLIDADCS